LEISEKRAQQSVQMISEPYDYTPACHRQRFQRRITGLPAGRQGFSRFLNFFKNLKKKLDKKTRSPLSLKSIDEVYPARNGRRFIRPFPWGMKHKSIFPQP
jgi:hypothetical protein